MNSCQISAFTTKSFNGWLIRLSFLFEEVRDKDSHRVTRSKSRFNSGRPSRKSSGKIDNISAKEQFSCGSPSRANASGPRRIFWMGIGREIGIPLVSRISFSTLKRTGPSRDIVVSGRVGFGFEGTQTYPANQWDSYLTTDAHPEYPSGTACVCSAWASGANLFFGTNVVNYTTTFPAGSSIIEPGFTPRNPVNVLIPTFLEEKGQPYTSSVEAFCGESRNLGGVHFLSSIAASKSVCPALGPPAYKNLKKLLAGDVSWKWWPH